MHVINVQYVPFQRKPDGLSYTSISRSIEAFDLLYLDAWRPYKTDTHNGCRFWLTIVDDIQEWSGCIHWGWRVMSPSSKVFFALFQIQFNRHVKSIRSDNGTKFFNTECNTFYKSLGIIN